MIITGRSLCFTGKLPFLIGHSPILIGTLLWFYHMGVSKTRGKTPKMNGENNGKP